MPSGTGTPSSSRPSQRTRCLASPASSRSLIEPAHLVALLVHHREGHPRGLRQVEPELGRVPHPVAVRREVERLGGEADDERELALQLLCGEEGGDRRQHEQREHRPDEGPGHGRRKPSGGPGERCAAGRAGCFRWRECARARSADRPLGRRGALRPRARGGAGGARGARWSWSRRGSCTARPPRRRGTPPTAASTGSPRASAPSGRALRRALKLAEHAPDMLLYRRHARRADVRHYQWLPLPALDAWLLPPARPRVLTLHNVLRAERLERRLLDADGRSRGAHAGGRRAAHRPPRHPARAGAGRSPTAPSSTSRASPTRCRCRRSCARWRGRSCCASASCDRTRAWTCCSRPSATWTPSSGWWDGRSASRWSGCGGSRRPGACASCPAT